MKPTIREKSMNWYSDANPNELCIVSDADRPQYQKISGTSNENEYRGVIWALEQMKSGDTLYSDSMLVVNQVTHGWKIKARHLQEYNFKAKQLIKEKNLILLWTPRESNLAGHLI